MSKVFKIFLAVFFLFTLISCATTKQVKESKEVSGNEKVKNINSPRLPAASLVLPVRLLDPTLPFYVMLPMSADKEVSKSIINFLLSQYTTNKEVTSKLLSSINCLYLSMKHKKEEDDRSIVIDYKGKKDVLEPLFATLLGTTPYTVTLPLPNTEEEAREEGNTLEDKEAVLEVSYKIFNLKEGNSFLFLSDDLAYYGKNAFRTLALYHYFAYYGKFPNASLEKIIESLQEEGEEENTNAYAELPEEVQEFLYFREKDKSEARFYALKPQSFLTTLTGTSLNFNLKYASGIMKTVHKSEDAYLLTLDLEFKNTKYIKAAAGSLTVAFGLSSASIEYPTSTHLTIEGVRVKKKTLYQVLGVKDAG